MVHEESRVRHMNLRPSCRSPICPPGSRRTALSPTWSDPEGSSHNDFVPGRRLPPFSTLSDEGAALKPWRSADGPLKLERMDDESPALGLDLPEVPAPQGEASPYRVLARKYRP